MRFLTCLSFHVPPLNTWVLWLYSCYHRNQRKHLTQNKNLQQSHSFEFQMFDPRPINLTDVQ